LITARLPYFTQHIRKYLGIDFASHTAANAAQFRRNKEVIIMRIVHRLAIAGGALALFAGTLSGFSPRVAAATPLTVGVIIPGSISDKGWMESGYDGLMAAEKKYGGRIKVQMIENVKDADMRQAVTTVAENNQIVIGVGGQTLSSIERVAPRFPNVKFTQIAGALDKAYPNVALFDVKQAEIGFVAGATAALLSKTHVIQFIGGTQLTPIVNAGIEFDAGAKYVDPKIKVITTYTGDFDDVEKAKEAALAAIAQGADLEYQILNLGVRGLEEAVREKGTHIIGSYTDRCGSDPLYIAYSITGVGHLVETSVDESVAGTWKPGYKPFGLAAGPKASGMVVCKGVSTPAIVAKIKEIEKAILAGKIRVLKS
jgi:basic membrane protein A and related proteins